MKKIYFLTKYKAGRYAASDLFLPYKKTTANGFEEILGETFAKVPPTVSLALLNTIL